MASSSSILIYGHDAWLLDTRRWVLEKAGFKVLTVSEFPAAIKAITVQAPLLVVLCHTLTAAERKDAIAVAAVYEPAIKTLSISTKRDVREEDVSETLYCLAGAEGLIGAVRRVLGIGQTC